jgi:serine/threonine-protein kinase PknK
VAWLTIREDDNALASFLSHLVEALRPIVPQLAGELLIPLQELGATIAQFALTTLINALDARSQPVTLVLDDWHHIHAPATIGAMDQLLADRAP